MDINYGRTLYEFVLGILNGVTAVKDFMFTTYTVGNISIFGIDIIDGFSFIPLVPTGGLVLILLTIGLVSAVNPL